MCRACFNRGGFFVACRVKNTDVWLSLLKALNVRMSVTVSPSDPHLVCAPTFMAASIDNGTEPHPFLLGCWWIIILKNVLLSFISYCTNWSDLEATFFFLSRSFLLITFIYCQQQSQTAYSILVYVFISSSSLEMVGGKYRIWPIMRFNVPPLRKPLFHVSSFLAFLMSVFSISPGGPWCIL